MYDRLKELNEQHMAYMAAFNELKRKISGVRRRCINKINLASEYGLVIDDQAEEMANLPRVTANMTITTLTALYNQVRRINFALDDLLKDQAESPRRTSQ